MRRLTCLILATLVVCSARSAGSEWTVGRKTLLYIRIDFSDLAGPPVADRDIAAVLAGVDEYYRASSFGNYVLRSTVTPTLRMPRPAAFYDGNGDSEAIIRDARAVARDRGFDTARYALDIVAFKSLRGGDSELANIGGKSARIINNFRAGIMLHAIGHNLGLGHTRYWQTNDGSVIGQGVPQEYGDPYDPMGGGGTDAPWANHYIARSKAALGWLGADGALRVKKSGTYRLFAHDLPAATGVRALQIDRDSKTEYWLEFRQRITENPLLMNGVRLHRLRPTDATLDLLNPNPGVPGGAHDAALLIGQTFVDAEAKIYVTPVQVNRTSPRPSMDVVVNLGDPPAHRPLKIDFSASDIPIAAATGPTEFTARVRNEDQVPLAIAWDFGDGLFAWGSARVAHRWRTPDRRYVVRATANDLWGQQASKVVVVTVGNTVGKPLMGIVRDASGAPVEGVRVNLVAEVPTQPSMGVHYGENTTLSDSDGQFAFAEPAGGRYMVQPLKQGYSFLPTKLNFPTTDQVSFIATAAATHPQGTSRATLRIRATIDGTPELRITHRGASWRPGQYGWPSDVKLNDSVMDPQKTLVNAGGTVFLPAESDFASAVVSKKSARGSVNIYRDLTGGGSDSDDGGDDDALVISFDDPQPGADTYELEIELSQRAR